MSRLDTARPKRTRVKGVTNHRVVSPKGAREKKGRLTLVQYCGSVYRALVYAKEEVNADSTPFLRHGLAYIGKASGKSE